MGRLKSQTNCEGFVEEVHKSQSYYYGLQRNINRVDAIPVQLLMNRRIKTCLIIAHTDSLLVLTPCISTELLKSRVYSNEEIRQKLEAKQTLTKLYYDRHTKKDYYDVFEPGDKLLYKTPIQLNTRKWQIADVLGKHDTLHSYINDTGTCKLRQIRVNLRKCASHLKGPTCNVLKILPTRTVVKPRPANSIPRAVEDPPWVKKTAVSNVPDTTPRQVLPPNKALTTQAAPESTTPSAPIHITRSDRQTLLPAKYKYGELDEIKATSGRLSS